MNEFPGHFRNFWSSVLKHGQHGRVSQWEGAREAISNVAMDLEAILSNFANSPSEEQ